LIYLLLASRQPHGRIRPTILLPIHTGQSSQQNRPALLRRKVRQKILSRRFGPFQYSGILPLAQPPRPQSLLDPLSERELEVLKLLTTSLTGPEIARELMISLNTMRTHTKNIYAKLGVNSRRTAVRRAEELNLL
jgi:LuxR family maltose regulon positive regulatory protein